MIAVLILLLSSVNFQYTFAHPGRTDSYGCHICRTNCHKWGLSYGEYHCHRSKGLPQPKRPIRSHKGNPGTTEYWPEYEIPKPKKETGPIPSPIKIPKPANIKSKPIENKVSPSNGFMHYILTLLLGMFGL